MITSLSFRDIYRQELRRVLESNDCHNPSGPGGGQFCSGSGGGGNLVHDAPGFSAGKAGMKQTSSAHPLAPSAAAVRAAGAKPVKHRFEFAPKGSPQLGSYRGMNVHTLPGYITPYYYVDAPGFGPMHHTQSFARIKNQINAFKDTGETPRGKQKRKGSERYQKRKAADARREQTRYEMDTRRSVPRV